MGRPMRPIDPADGAVQAFAADLRDLRAKAGNPPFRQLARRAHYSATTLSVACAGTSLPTLDVTLAFVRACDGPAGYWEQRWHEVAPASRAGTADTIRATTMAATRRQWRPVIIAGVALVAAAAGAIGWWSADHGASSVRPTPARQLYAGVSPCDIGAVVLGEVHLTLPSPLRLAGRSYPAGTVVGQVALRVSPRCGLAWTRFLPAPAFNSVHAGTLVLQSRRVADGATTTVSLSPVVAAEGDPLLTVPGCVFAQATVRFGPGQPTATAMTGCYS